MGCGIAHRCDSDPMLLWLWRRPAATAPIQPLGWELSYAAGVALKSKKKKKKKFKKTKRQTITSAAEDVGKPEPSQTTGGM